VVGQFVDIKKGFKKLIYFFGKAAAESQGTESMTP